MRRPIRRLSAVLATAVTVLALTACAGEPAPELEPVDVGEAPAEATPAGTTLGIGETAWILDEEDGELVAVTVREVRELDPESIEGFADDPQFSGQTPYAVITQYDASAGTSVGVLPIDETGELVGWVAADVGNTAGADAGCGIPLPEQDTINGIEFECVVALADGAPVVGAVYNGSNRSDFTLDESHPFAATPLTWR